ncbi:hypothetical protein OOT46_30165 [Aquabacterium sp. A7-Y]|uniref:hypothetical protein n=1 Tax=Aquabacterium sp. A7-Y TaxID=1349605 RepID=UPI00223D0E06|nr:hypothetical protein [Aquabacterium sp. A7-Y]MCW7542063.1 hypothetical protein [Aquabacterium sp. A7-Y]
MQRRRLLQLGIASTVVLALAGAGVSMSRPGLEAGRLTPAGQEVLRAIARAVLDGSLPHGGAPLEAALASQLQRVEALVAAMPGPTRQELSQLLGVLASAPGRRLLAGLEADWRDASVAQLQASLQDMRRSRLAVRQQAYHALRELSSAAYYADPASWQAIGYPGPTDL